MKKTVKLLALFCALIMLVSLAACGEKMADDAKDSGSKTADSSVEEADSNLTDFGWVKFEMPEGWSDAKESDAYVTIAEDADDHHKMKLFKKSLGSDTIQSKIEKDYGSDDYYTVENDPIELSGRTWYVVRFTFNNNPSVMLFTDLVEGKLFYINVFEMDENADAVKTVLDSLTFDESKID